MDIGLEALQAVTRRQFLRQCGTGIGALALTSLLNEKLFSAPTPASTDPLAPVRAHFAPKAKRVIYLHMSGSPTQLDMFDYKPKLVELDGKPCPDSLIKNERFAFIKGVPKMLGTPHKFARHGACGTELSELLPRLGTVVDDMAVVRSMVTDQFNHAPAQLLLQTGTSRLGRPSMGSWLTYGLGSDASDLPAFVVLVSGGKVPSAGTSLWGSGFLPTVYQGVQCRSQGDPVLYLSNPPGMSPAVRRRALDALRDLNEMSFKSVGDPEITTRIAQYEMAYRMQTSVPEVMDISKEPAAVQEAYEVQPGKAAFANNCLLARRLVERGVRFVQLYDWGWDHHGNAKTTDIVHDLPNKCRSIDGPCAALLRDLKQRGMLDETLVIWGGEFGRTPMNEERNGSKWLGRDHHPHAFSMWMAGGGIKGGITHGATDELGYHVVEDKVHVHDLQATVLHCMGLNHEKLTYRFQGRDYRLTDVAGNVVPNLLA